MKTKFKVLGAAIAGLVCAAAIIGNAHAQAKPPAYLVVEFEVTDPVGWKEYADAARALGSLGRFIVRGAKGVPLAGEPPRSITIVMFPSMEAAVAFDSSAAYTALKANRAKASKWRSYVAEGLPN